MKIRVISTSEIEISPSWQEALEEDGIDVTDIEEVVDWIETFHSISDDEVDRVATWLTDS